VSFLLAEGHVDPHFYPLSKLWLETELARERVNQRHVTDATLMQAVIIAALQKNGGKFLEKQIKKLTDG
jgi:hypothetical protein